MVVGPMDLKWENEMKSTSKFSSVIFPAALVLGLCIGSVQARVQNPPTSDHSNSMGQASSDTWITTKVKTELASTKGVSSTDISVNTVNGVVTLTGVLSTDIEVKKATAVARSVKGVKGVDASGLKSK